MLYVPQKVETQCEQTTNLWALNTSVHSRALLPIALGTIVLTRDSPRQSGYPYRSYEGLQCCDRKEYTLDAVYF
jgi:hypothetical protein